MAKQASLWSKCRETLLKSRVPVPPITLYPRTTTVPQELLDKGSADWNALIKLRFRAADPALNDKQRLSLVLAYVRGLEPWLATMLVVPKGLALLGHGPRGDLPQDRRPCMYATFVGDYAVAALAATSLLVDEQQLERATRLLTTVVETLDKIPSVKEHLRAAFMGGGLAFVRALIHSLEAEQLLRAALDPRDPTKVSAGIFTSTLHHTCADAFRVAHGALRRFDGEDGGMLAWCGARLQWITALVCIYVDSSAQDAEAVFTYAAAASALTEAGEPQLAAQATLLSKHCSNECRVYPDKAAAMGDYMKLVAEGRMPRLDKLLDAPLALSPGHLSLLAQPAGTVEEDAGSVAVQEPVLSSVSLMQRLAMYGRASAARFAPAWLAPLRLQLVEAAIDMDALDTLLRAPDDQVVAELSLAPPPSAPGSETGLDAVLVKMRSLWGSLVQRMRPTGAVGGGTQELDLNSNTPQEWARAGMTRELLNDMGVTRETLSKRAPSWNKEEAIRLFGL